MQIDQSQIILTGAASGIGRALLGLLVDHPCRVIAVDIQPDRLEDAIRAAGGQAEVIPYVGDMGNAQDIDALFDLALSALGGIDLLIACAGFAYYEKLEQAEWDRLARIFEVNTLGPIYAAVRMREINRDRPYKVVMVASAMARLAIPGYAIYSATKAALDRFAEGYRLELDDPARLLLVYPIGTRTGFFHRSARGKDAPYPWPTQNAEHVARCILRGIERDQQAVHPSRLFMALLLADRLFPLTRRLEQAIELRRFRRWLHQM
ncbi:MAG: SDR family NAD(P)-dependent oxidoreductase [Anaerolineae bacterium]|nr:SDR family NAD(P)-dependent oxidoreductase [Anaerolineae bacterium]